MLRRRIRMTIDMETSFRVHKNRQPSLVVYFHARMHVRARMPLVSSVCRCNADHANTSIRY